MEKKKDVLNLVSKKYSREMLKSLADAPKRFKDLSAACGGEKMRAQRLKEFEEFGLVKVNVERIGRRPVSVYELSDVGKSTLRLAEDIKKLQKKSQS
ncbi:MAG: helix-turn-helix transcriptional regulator [Candidatus Aenigmarchaeota archaeon]|nr:helix-turn-helix transcriptional regulator [Candidatus Aenigmarchaeota archaeon]